jgi:nickel-type superoxide dismutase maturation protease
VSPPLTRATALRTAAAATVLAVPLALSALVRRVEVVGGSMRPTLQPGDRVAVLPLPPAPGRLVVVRDPREPARILVKRCAAVHADGAVEVRGDDPAASTDSRQFGAVPPALVEGRPAYRYHPPDAARWVLRA